MDHGGGFSTGNSANYDGTYLAAQGAVVVTINYRVGIFGFFTHPALSKEDPHGISGNYGMRDMICALQWVQRNITNFGGSPDNVTIFGQSAGGTAVVNLMASPLAAGLFHKAIAQSNGAYNLWPHLKKSEGYGEKFAAALGVDNDDDVVQAMREKSWEELMATETEAKLRFNEVIDGHILPTNPVATFKEGKQHNVPFLAGSNSDESDRGFTVCTRVFARWHSKINPNTYRYYFSQNTPDGEGGSKDAVHAAELPYVFNGGTLAALHFDDQCKSLAKTMSAMWIQFARSGNPNGPGIPIQWPPYNFVEESYLEFGQEIQTGTRLKRDVCEKMEASFDQGLAQWQQKVSTQN